MSLLKELRGIARETIRQATKLTVSQWADEFRIVSGAAESGPWDTTRAEYQREWMDEWQKPGSECCIMCCAQSGKSEAAILNPLGYIIDQDPGKVLVIQPDVSTMAKAFSKERIAPMIEDTPVLRGKVRDARSRDSGNTTTHKEFDGGSVTIVGSNSAASLASRPIRDLFGDEIDKYAESAGAEGDPIALGEKRQRTYGARRRRMYTSTPSIKGRSRIEAMYELSDQRHWLVPCPECEHKQEIVWDREPGDEHEAAEKRFQWELNDEGEITNVTFACESCGFRIRERHIMRMTERGEWHASRPGRKRIGWQINAFAVPWGNWAEIVQEYVDAGEDPALLQVFWNAQLGLPYEEKLAKADPKDLDARREVYQAEIPGPVAVLTAFTDVQDDRLEIAVKGWGPGQESWLIDHARIYGNPKDPYDECWTELEEWRVRKWAHESGQALRIRCFCIDSGYATEQVYGYCRGKQKYRVWPTKGYANPQQATPIIGHVPQKSNRSGVKVVTVGVNTAKTLMFARLKIARPGPGFMHFPHPTAQGIDDEYMEQFGAEQMRVTKKGGIDRVEFIEKRKRNEAIDLEVGNLAALHLLGPGVHARLHILSERLNRKDAPAKMEADDDTDPQINQANNPAAQRLKELKRKAAGKGRRKRWKDR